MLVYVPTRNISNKQILQQGDIVMCTSSGSPDVVGRLQPNSPLQTPAKGPNNNGYRGTEATNRCALEL